MDTVYCIQEPRPTRANSDDVKARDFSSAHRYGKLVFLLAQQDNPSQLPGPSLRKMSAGLQEFRPGDYLMYAGGDPLGMLLAGVALRDLGYSEVSFLRWDREISPSGERLPGGYYTPITVRLRV